MSEKIISATCGELEVKFDKTLVEAALLGVSALKSKPLSKDDTSFNEMRQTLADSKGEAMAQEVFGPKKVSDKERCRSLRLQLIPIAKELGLTVRLTQDEKEVLGYDED